MTGQSSSQAATPVQWWKPALFFLVVIVGLWYVKWQPYYGKAFTAAETHSIGKSILAQADASPLQAAWDYAMVYFLAVWKAAVLGVILGSLIQVLIPRNWLVKTLGQPRFQGTLLGTIFSLPGMMCSCCAAPVAAGMRRQRVSMGGALAFWMGNPLLNPATLVFMGFVLGWHFAFIRLVAGLLTVLVVATLVQNLVKDNAVEPASVELDVSEPQGVSLRWGRRYGSFSGAPSRSISWRYWFWGRRASGFPTCGWRYRQHADVGHCDGRCRLPVCDPNGG
jgi:uncharacterized membrane protein YraQ (UPF0718 family)